MEKNALGTWTYTIPLLSDTFNYSFRVDDEKGLDKNAIAYANEWARKDLAASQVCVPFDAKFQSDDRSVDMPRPGNYQYYLIMSSGLRTEDRQNLKAPLDANSDYSAENLAVVRSRNILVSTDLQDQLLPYVLEMHKRFAKKEVPFTNYHVEGGHQLDNWRQV